MSFRFLIVLIVATKSFAAGKLLNGANLKFAATDFPPYNVLTLMPDGNYTDTGSSPSHFTWLAEKLNFTISYYYLPNELTEIKYKNMGDISILLSLISDKKIDGSSRIIIENLERRKLVDFANFMWAEPFAMIVPRPGEEPRRLFAFVYPFQLTVWLFIYIAMFTTLIFMAQFARIYSNLSTVIDSVSRSRRISVIERSIDYSMYLASIVTNQGNILAVNRLSFRFLVGTWALVATVLVNSYSSTVISYMTVSKNKPAINTFEDLVASENVELIVLADTTTKKQIMEAESAGAMKTLGDQIRNNPSRILNNLQKVSDLLETERYAFPNPQSFCNNFVARQFREKGQCRFKTTDPLSMNIFLSLPLQKNSKFTPIFKHALLQLWETGLPQHWVKSSMPQAPKCFQKTNLPNTAIPKPIQLGDLTGAFLILGVGFGLATFFFLMENIIRCRSLRTATIGQK